MQSYTSFGSLTCFF